MKFLLALSTLALLSPNVRAELNVVYGQDNRQDVYQSNNSLHKLLAQSTAAMIDRVQFVKSSKQGFYNLKSLTLEESANVCSSELFSQQQTAASCSGFLVGPDTLITAGHCYKSFSTPQEVCRSSAWVFDYDMKSANSNPAMNVPLTNVYLCKKVLDAQLTGSLDYTIIKLDRPVTGRQPLKFRKVGLIPNNTKLVVIGHPTGLPTKISPNGKVTRNIAATTFSTNLDTFQGNSGSAVFNSETGVVEGILIQGKTDYVPSIKGNPKSCMVVNTCNDDAGECKSGIEAGPIMWGEVVFRIGTISRAIEKALATNF